mmetsp:Transcript_39231/g.81413  ORF Transcript_39231/g.81413 Transcript_39231/m.81413 type:complete len:204 (+) Transcript_39231:642-1253(+)
MQKFQIPSTLNAIQENVTPDLFQWMHCHACHNTNGQERLPTFRVKANRSTAKSCFVAPHFNAIQGCALIRWVKYPNTRSPVPFPRRYRPSNYSFFGFLFFVSFVVLFFSAAFIIAIIIHVHGITVIFLGRTMTSFFVNAHRLFRVQSIFINIAFGHRNDDFPLAVVRGRRILRQRQKSHLARCITKIHPLRIKRFLFSPFNRC